MFTLLTFIIVLGLLIFVHEFGHFMAAKKQGIGVEEFGFGFPPRIFGLRRKEVRQGAASPRRVGILPDLEIVWGNKSFETDTATIYSLNWIPFGGFVRIKGESGEKTEEPDSFASRNIWERTLVVVMGVLANTLLCIVLFSIGFSVGMPQVIGEKISSYAKISNRHIEVLTVLPDSPAEKAGVKPGDTIVSVNGQLGLGAQALKDFVAQNVGRELEISIERQSQMLKLKSVPEILKETGKAGIGIGMAEVGIVRYPIWLALPKGVEMTGQLTKAIFQAFGDMIRDLILGKKITVELAGPVGIAVLTGEVARLGWIYLLQFVAILSINLAIINALPFPALDGGRFLFLIIEKFRGRPVSRKVELVIHNIGFFLLLLLIVLVTYRDVARHSGEIVEWASKVIQ